jgi:hypothetical protein
MVLVMHSTLTDNAADYGGEVSNEGALTITDSAIVRSRAHAGAGILNRGTLINTILALNTAPGVLGPDCFGRIISRGHNLLGDTADCSIRRQSSDLVGDPDVGDFADDGASGHVYFPPLPASRAIDAGDSAACPLVDQLGHPRFNVCDSGAVECTPPRCMQTSLPPHPLTSIGSRSPGWSAGCTAPPRARAYSTPPGSPA